jgi:hypothetical protein
VPPASIELDRLDPRVIARDSIMWDVFKKAYEQGITPAACRRSSAAAPWPRRQPHRRRGVGWGADFAIALGVTSFPFQFARAAAGLPALLEEVVKLFGRPRGQVHRLLGGTSPSTAPTR